MVEGAIDLKIKGNMLAGITKKVSLSLMLSFVILISSFNSAFATSSSKNIKEDFTVTPTLIEEMAASLTDQELTDNPYLLDVLVDMKEIVNDSKDISFTALNSQLHERESYTNHMNSRLEKNESITRVSYTQEDEEQLQRVDRLAQYYYDYHQEHGYYPQESMQTASLASSVTVLKGMGLAFTESGLATRLAALGLVATVDGPLPVGDFIALVSGAVMVGGFVYSYLSAETAIANNIGVYEGQTYRISSTKSLSATRVIAYPNNYKHFSAAPNNGWGGGVFVLEPIPYTTAAFRASVGMDTYSLTVTDARAVAQAATATGLSPVHVNTK
ncbi:hypothetical protein [Paenibacillus arenilitoris]|uniref:Uncharacterized protein n=1 Tax=Paenibacillus arenilitoris TaxID=2772299 RepID=A0A927CQL9_9BACL|nr:hypothetical protein [Paenibacillus arenilitoris]MBD2871013.1 hypothetical protein [Paenibacillus arenilitoris]